MIEHLLATARDFAARHGPDDAARAIVEVAREVAQRRGETLLLERLPALAARVEQELPHLPVLARVLRRVEARPGDLRERLDEEDRNLVRANDGLAEHGAAICANEAVYVHGLSRRHTQFIVRAARATRGLLTVFVSGPEDGAVDATPGRMAEDVRFAFAALQRAGVEGARVIPVRLAASTAAVARARCVLVLAGAVSRDGRIAGLRGTEVVAELAATYGPGITALVTNDDLVDTIGRYRDPNFVLLDIDAVRILMPSG